LAFEKAANQLKRACTSLERQLPPPEDGGTDETPPLVPRQRADSITGCAACVSDLLDLEPGEREGHRCTHQGDGSQRQARDDVVVTTSDVATARAKVSRVRQPALGVIQEYMSSLDTCLERYIDAVTVVCSTLTDRTEQELYQDHLIVWVEHVEALKDRARETTQVLEAALQLSEAVHVPSMEDNISNPGPSSRPYLVSSNVTSGTSIALSEANTMSSESFADRPLPMITATAVNSFAAQGALPPPRTANTNGGRSAPIMSVTLHDSLAGASQAQLPPRGWVTTENTAYSSTNLELAVRQMNSIGQAIHEDLSTAVEEVALLGSSSPSEANIAALNEYCRTIKEDIEVKYQTAAEKAANDKYYSDHGF